MTEHEKKRVIAEWISDYEIMKVFIEQQSELLKDTEGIENDVINIPNADIQGNIKLMKERLELLDSALNVLTERERIVLIEHCQKNKYYSEICNILHVSERTAKRIKSQALSKMLVVLGE